jgi:hypothetical protein
MPLVRAQCNNVLPPTAACGIVHLMRHSGILPSFEAQADGSWMKEQWAASQTLSTTKPSGIAARIVPFEGSSRHPRVSDVQVAWMLLVC